MPHLASARTETERLTMLTRLTPAHFALYRAYLGELDEPILRAHYGVPSTDVRVMPCRPHMVESAAFGPLP
ncbi:hypothetical protein DF024_28895 [Burkholderia cenocepacia]|nr:hypothetical protein DF024_28895 [Burkholderia cenocepacia]